MAGKDDERLSEVALSPGVQRLDKWLWFARITKSRTLAAQFVQDGRVRVNRTKAAKPSQTVRPGDVLTIAAPGGTIKVIKVLAPGARRGPPAETRLLYEMLASMGGRALARPGAAQRERGTGRPTKRDRRLTDRLTEDDG